MKKINLKMISEILSEKEMKNVVGGSGSGSDCSNASCSYGGNTVTCYGYCVDVKGSDGVVCGKACAPCNGNPANGGGSISVNCK